MGFEDGNPVGLLDLPCVCQLQAALRPLALGWYVLRFQRFRRFTAKATDTPV